jgi:hypothetical protein
MTKPKVWCCHPLRHNGASRVGQFPSHAKGKVRLSSQLVTYLQRKYSVAMMFPAGSNETDGAYMCACCYEFEMDQMQRSQSGQQPWNDEMAGSDSESSLHERLRSSTGTLTVRDYSKMAGQAHPSGSEGSDASSEDESATAHERLSAKETLDNVFRLLQIEGIVDV